METVPEKYNNKVWHKHIFLLKNAGPIDDVVPTIGFSNLELKQFNKFPVEIYDLGGGVKIRSIWRNYFALIHGIIYVVDSADESRIPEVRQNLHEVFRHDSISKKPILVWVSSCQSYLSFSDRL